MADTDESLDVVIIDPNKVIYEGKAVKVFAPGKIDEIAFLPEHTPLYSLLVPGTVTVEEITGHTVEKRIDGGVARVKNNTLKILVGF